MFPAYSSGAIITNMKTQNILYVMNIDPLKDPDRFDAWYRKMPKFRQQKIDALKPLKSKLQCLGAGILMQKAMADIGIESYEIKLGEVHKPYIDGHSDVFFNISHSGDVVILGISDKEIGVDVEKIKHFSDNLIDYVFTQEDQALAKELTDSESDADRIYTRLWTVKESIMKHSGRGIALTPKSIALSFKNGMIKASSADYDCEALYLLPYETDDHQITVCSEYNDFVMRRV